MFGSNYFGHPYFGQGYAQTVGAFEELSGTVSCTSVLAGELYRTRLISGQIDAITALTGELYRVRPLSGLVPTVASVSGNLYLVWGLSGEIAALSTLSGELSLLGQVELSGTVAATASLSGLLYRVRDINGSVEAVVTLAANLYVIWALTGTIGAVSRLVANLEAAIADPFRPPIGQAVGDEALTAHSHMVGGLAAHGIIATPILPGRGVGNRTPLATACLGGLPPWGHASSQPIPRSGSVGVVETMEGAAAGLYVPPGTGQVTPQLPKGIGRKNRTREGEAETDRPPQSGKAG